MRKEIRKIAIERIEKLFKLAQSIAKENPTRARRYVELARRIGMKAEISIPRKHKRKFCRGCNTFFIPGKTCKVRLNNGQVSYLCLSCGRVARYPYLKEKKARRKGYALLIIDMLNDFISSKGALYVKGSRKIIPAIKKLAKRFRKLKFKVIYINDSHEESDEEFKLWPKHAVKGRWGSKVIPELRPRKEDLIVEKKRYSGFEGTKLLKILRSIRAKALCLVGVVTEICIYQTAISARERDYEVYIIKDGVMHLDEKGAKGKIEKMEGRGIKILSLEEAMQLLRG
jgi:nicotinamidase-related amidase